MGDEVQAQAQAQAEAWRLSLAFADSLAVKSAIELGIPDLLQESDTPLSLPEIAMSLPSTSPDTTTLSRIMRFLVRKHVFTSQEIEDETRYGPTRTSGWLTKQVHRPSLAPFLLLETGVVSLKPWHYLSRCVLEGGEAFEKAHGVEIWGYGAKNREYSRLFNEAMACNAQIVLEALLRGYENGFEGLGSLVDVGGGTGMTIGEIVRANPHISGINFDLPHVVATAPHYPGVVHIGGDMFHAIPQADAVFMKWIMHDWGDEDCVKILKQCKRAIPEKTGKVIIVDAVVGGKEGVFGDATLAFDLVMIAHSSGGKERTAEEWGKLLKDGGFRRFNIISIPTIQSVIEAFPE
ncbi:(R,S)-reticuline 7-O-methyltransferase [Amborella trichopoda]|uniref:(R,S)-reticuline 7-O-methyltransferase n=1 Tax=Amborella trichopoda TaxID=13333 RepID=UPI0005D3772A|nr:(R,S)-reticuline 7-O-methyltransferase [Amborella trichopoda]|eukprot:XP_011622314.1 (R,S)-reticuline 7-O-methyltransferase [Amborella trichopoda]